MVNKTSSCITFKWRNDLKRIRSKSNNHVLHPANWFPCHEYSPCFMTASGLSLLFPEHTSPLALGVFRKLLCVHSEGRAEVPGFTSAAGTPAFSLLFHHTHTMSFLPHSVALVCTSVTKNKPPNLRDSSPATSPLAFALRRSSPARTCPCCQNCCKKKWQERNGSRAFLCKNKRVRTSADRKTRY